MFTGCAVASAVQKLPYERQRHGRQGCLNYFGHYGKNLLLQGCIYENHDRKASH